MEWVWIQSKGSSYEIASVLKFPVILLINARGAAMTLAAVLKGMTEYRPDSNICGVILNRYPVCSIQD